MMNQHCKLCRIVIILSVLITLFLTAGVPLTVGAETTYTTGDHIQFGTYPQSRVTDHRIKLTLYSIDAVMNGDLDQIIDPLITADQEAKLLKVEEA